MHCLYRCLRKQMQHCFLPRFVYTFTSLPRRSSLSVAFLGHYKTTTPTWTCWYCKCLMGHGTKKTQPARRTSFRPILKMLSRPTPQISSFRGQCCPAATLFAAPPQWCTFCEVREATVILYLLGHLEKSLCKTCVLQTINIHYFFPLKRKRNQSQSGGKYCRFISFINRIYFFAFSRLVKYTGLRRKQKTCPPNKRRKCCA